MLFKRERIGGFCWTSPENPQVEDSQQELPWLKIDIIWRSQNTSKWNGGPEILVIAAVE